MQNPRTLEEGVAALAEVLGDRDLNAAADGKYGPEVRLLVLGEKSRRETRRRKAAAS